MPTFQPSALPAGAYRVSNKNHDYWIVDADGNIIGQTGANGRDTLFVTVTTDPNTGVQTWYPDYFDANLLSGEDQTNDWMKIADGASLYQFLVPQPTTGSLLLLPLTNKLLGSTGGIGDYLKSLTVIATSGSPTDTGVYLTDGVPTNVTSGTAGGTFAGVPAGTVLALTASSVFTVSANQLAGCILTLTYVPTNGTAVTMKRKITEHAAVSGATAFAPKLSSDTPAGATLSGWTVEPAASSVELLPPNMPKGVYHLPLGLKSLVGGWRVSIGTQVQVVATGKFS